MIVTASKLNVRSGPGTEFRTLAQVGNGDRVDVLEVSGDWAWITKGAGWVSRAYLMSENMVAPDGLDAIHYVFGQPGSPECSGGRVILPRPLKLGWENSMVTRVACHVKMEEVFTRVFRDLDRAGLWDSLHTFDGIYNDRPTKGGSKKSTHSWGIAVDLNASTNAQGTAGNMDPRVVNIFRSQGFIWGGNWSGAVRDPMHFQFATGY